jgi:integration host factor subunit alpha
MGGKTVTRADLAEAVYRKVGLSRTESAQLVEMVLEEICEAIVRGETVKLSSFATFQVRSKNERMGRNPKTGEEVPILAAPRDDLQGIQRAQAAHPAHARNDRRKRPARTP